MCCPWFCHEQFLLLSRSLVPGSYSCSEDTYCLPVSAHVKLKERLSLCCISIFIVSVFNSDHVFFILRWHMPSEWLIHCQSPSSPTAPPRSLRKSCCRSSTKTLTSDQASSSGHYYIIHLLLTWHSDYALIKCFSLHLQGSGPEETDLPEDGMLRTFWQERLPLGNP